MATNKTTNPGKVVIGPVRLSYTHLFEPAAVNEGDEKKYSTSVIIPKKDKMLVAEIESAIEAAKQDGIKSKWGGAAPKKLKLPLRDGDEERDDEAYADAYFLNANCKTRPGVVDRNRKPVMDEEEVYSGCYAFVSLTFYPFDNKGNRGIACGLNNVMKVKDGERLGGRISAEADFAKVEVDEADDEL